MIDAQLDANVFGEQIRNYAFVASLGCYTSFELKDSFKPVDRGSREALEMLTLLGWIPPEERSNQDCSDSDSIISSSKIFTDGVITLAWHWDGDGTLAVLANGFAAVNNDCKKVDNWEWSSLPQMPANAFIHRVDEVGYPCSIVHSITGEELIVLDITKIQDMCGVPRIGAIVSPHCGSSYVLSYDALLFYVPEGGYE